MPFTIKYLVDDEKYIDRIEEFLHKWRDSSLHIDTYTSGSTGKPKLISIKKEYMVQSAKMTGELLDLKKGDNALLNLSIDTIAGKMMVVRSLVLGLNLFIVKTNSNPFQSDNKLPRIDFIALVPLQISSILKANVANLKSIRNILIGGANSSFELIDQLRSYSIQAYQTFGMTETISHFALKKIGLVNEESYTTHKDVTISKNLLNNTLIINAPKLGVLQLNTNDVVEITDIHKFKWLGRTDFVINSGGIKIHPEEIENLLSKHIKREFFLFGLKDNLLGEKLVLIVEDSEKQLKIDFKQILNSKYHIPKEVFFVERFIRTSSNKVDRKKTLERYKLI